MGEPSGKFVSNESAQAKVRVMAAVLLGIGAAAAYWVWPAGITDLPLAAITFGALLRAGASSVIVLLVLAMVALLWAD